MPDPVVDPVPRKLSPLAALLAVMETADQSVGKVWSLLSPALDETGEFSPASELVEDEILAEFHATATMFLRAMRRAGTSALKRAGDCEEGEPAEDPETERQHLIRSIEDTGMMLPVSLTQQLSTEQLTQAHNYAAAQVVANQFGKPVITLPKPDFLP